MSFDALAARAQFPLLAASPNLRYLDNAATTQLHASALDALVRHETTARANVLRGTHRLAEAADAAFAQARRQAAGFLGTHDADEVIFTSGATAGINLVAHAFGATLAPGDEIVVSLAEHHSNFLPWQALRDRAGITLRTLPLAADGSIDVSALADCVTERCRLIAVAHAGNVTGAVTDVAAVVRAARSVGARVLLDGAQWVQHGPVDVNALDVDFYAFSGHKCFGPTGIGVLWGRRELLARMPPFLTGGGMAVEVGLEGSVFASAPTRFEAGTPPIAQAVALGAVLEWMMAQPWADIHAHEARLAKRLIAGLATLPNLRLLGPSDGSRRLPVVSFDVPPLHPHDVCQILGERDIAVRGGHHCAQPLLAALGVESATRASIAMYNTEADIDALVAALFDVVEILT